MTTAEKNMQCSYETMRTVTEVLKRKFSDDVEVQTCLSLLDRTMSAMPQGRRRQDDVLECTTMQSALKMDTDMAHRLQRSGLPVAKMIEEAFANGVCMARAEEAAQEARHLRVVALVQAHQIMSEQSTDHHEEEMLSSPSHG